MKLNVDCSWVDSDKPSSIAGILRNSKGMVVNGFAKDVRASTPLQAEAVASPQGHLFLKQRTETHVGEGQVQKVQGECESDSSSSVEMVLGRDEPPWALRNILIECNDLLAQQVSAKLSHCPRQANQAVDWVAKAHRTRILPPSSFGIFCFRGLVHFHHVGLFFRVNTKKKSQILTFIPIIF